MAAQKGQDLLIKIDLDGTRNFETLAGLRASRIALNAATVDASSMESGGWRELLEGAGLRSVAVSGSGLFRDRDSDERAREIFFGARHAQLQVIIPDFGAIVGKFQLTALEYSGKYDGEALYEMAFASAGAIEFQPL
ncbi:phage major tail protein, TP901-1 family [Paracoccaceae bacterium GXU_MW_L88]